VRIGGLDGAKAEGAGEFRWREQVFPGCRVGRGVFRRELVEPGDEADELATADEVAGFYILCRPLVAIREVPERGVPELG